MLQPLDRGRCHAFKDRLVPSLLRRCSAELLPDAFGGPAYGNNVRALFQRLPLRPRLLSLLFLKHV